MEFPFFMSRVMQPDDDGMVVLSGIKHKQTIHKQFEQKQPKESLDIVIDNMGEASAKAQGLKQIITQANKFYGTDQTLYCKVEGRQCQALLKVGRKNLFHRDQSGNVKEVQPLCLLDFYVHESIQRNGLGKLIFEHMLTNEGIEPHQLAYDRPSNKLISFLKKHYNLSNFIPQNNNFVIYNQYWTNQNKIKQVQVQQQTTNEPRLEIKQEISEKQQDIKSDKQVTKQQTRQETKQETKQGTKQETKQEIKRESIKQLLQDPVKQIQDPIKQVQVSREDAKLSDIKNRILNTNEEINQLSAQIKELSLKNTKPQQAMQTPWATNNTMMYQTTSKMMSNQIVKNTK